MQPRFCDEGVQNNEICMGYGKVCASLYLYMYVCVYVLNAEERASGKYNTTSLQLALK